MPLRTLQVPELTASFQAQAHPHTHTTRLLLHATLLLHASAMGFDRWELRLAPFLPRRGAAYTVHTLKSKHLKAGGKSAVFQPGDAFTGNHQQASPQPEMPHTLQHFSGSTHRTGALTKRAHPKSGHLLAKQPNHLPNTAAHCIHCVVSLAQILIITQHSSCPTVHRYTKWW